MPTTQHPPIGPTAVPAEPEGPRRSALVQDRSRRTRRKLVRAALTLWTERGFDRGVEETTVEEIARAAGVTKGTFYFHFAHKEDILLELGWGTAEALYEEATDGEAEDRPADQLLDDLLVSLCFRVESVPRVAVARSVAEFSRRGRPDDGRTHFGIRQSFTVVLELARRQGILHPDADAGDIAGMLEAVVMDALLSWARSLTTEALVDILRRRAAIVVNGARRPAPALSGPRPKTERRAPAVRREEPS